MKYYYAVFTCTAEAIEVEFPDLPGCVSFGQDWETALNNAEDVLAGWLAHANAETVNPPSKYETLSKTYTGLMPITINQTRLAAYAQRKRFNVIFPETILKRIDQVRKKTGLKRSTFLQKAAEAYLYQYE